MEYNEYPWQRNPPLGTGVAFSAAEVETMAKLMFELRELTLSRSSYLAASVFLKRFGCQVDAATLVRPEAMAG